MRLFIAIRFDVPVLDALAGVQADLRQVGVQGHFTREENLHLTLAFIGEYDDPNAVLEAMERVSFAPFTLRLGGIGSFGDLFWTGIEENEELSKLVRRIRHSLSDGDIPFDRKRFRPHITLIRKASWRRKEGLPEITSVSAEMTVDHIVLMRSERGKHGMVYSEMGSVAAAV